jgi:A/G-specific adenine glycosylase
MDATAKHLLDWYDVHARSLPWRSPPGKPPPEPYRVWLSEVMLQQTTVAAVGPYFARFLERWPTVEALAAADDADVMAAWAGLGYYARARNLLACARAVAARGGAFPDSEDGLRALPGLGAYTAAAVAAIAFDRRAAVVDANVERVVARLYAISEPLPKARARDPGAGGGIDPRQTPRRFRAGDDGSGIGGLHGRGLRAACCAHCKWTVRAALLVPKVFRSSRRKSPNRSGRGKRLTGSNGTVRSGW